MVKHEADYTYVRPSAMRSLAIWLMPLIVFVGSLILYIRTMAPSLYWGDSAAFASASYILGLPHSPSFPLYTLLGRLFMLIPGLEPAFASNLMSAIFAALAVMMFYMLAKMFIDVPAYKSEVKHFVRQADNEHEMKVIKDESLVGSSFILLPVFVVTALFAVSLPVWLSAVRTEVYSLHLFLTLAALLSCFKGVKEENRRFLFLGFWLYALSFANHPLLALAFIPAFIYLFISQWRQFGQKFGSIMVVTFFAFIAFSIYFYLPFRAAFEPGINWGRPDSLQGFLAAITRSADMSDFAALTAAPDYLLRLKKIGLFMADQIGWPLIGLLLFGFWGIYKISKKIFPFILLAVVFNLAVVLWAADFDPRNYDMVNYLAPLLGLVLIISTAGFLYIIRIKIVTGHASVITAVLAGAFVFVGVSDNIVKADLSNVRGPDLISMAVIHDVPDGSILMAAEDDLLLPLWYRAYVDSSAHKIDVLSPGAMLNPAYRRQLMTNYPHLIFPDGFDGEQQGKADDWAREICRLNLNERDIYLQFGVPGFKHDEIVPHGVVFKYVGDDSRVTFDTNFYQKHLDIIAAMVEGCENDSRTVDFTGRWVFTLGVYYERFGQHEIAWKLFKQSLAIDRESIDLRLHLATALARAKRYKEALKYLSDALEIDSQDADCLRLGRSILNAMKREGAIAQND